MNELQAEIEAAGLPAPKVLSVRWDIGIERFEIHELSPRVAGFLVRWYGQPHFGAWETNTEERLPTAAEAAAKVKEWMDEA